MTRRSHPLALLGLGPLGLAFLSGCSVEVVQGGASTCEVSGQSFDAGESFPSDDGCNTCTCLESGEVACTAAFCAGTCEYAGKAYAEGQSFPAEDGCNTCTCGPDGSVGCTKQDCPATCEFEGKTYAEGETWEGDCNSCQCQPGGVIGCTAMACNTCVYQGKSYAPGDSFPAQDGCNTCTCAADGSVACTEIHCACDPEKEWWREYAATDPKTCTLIDYACPPNTSHFSNECGCGCEQDPSCPEYFNCMPPTTCDEDALSAQCPYSKFAY